MRFRTAPALSIILAAAAAPAALGQNTWVIPPAHTNVEGTGAAVFIFQNAARTYLMTLPGADFANAPGNTLVGFTTRMRRTTAGTWPTQDLHFDNYDVYIGELAVPIGTFQEVIAENIIPGTEVQVRSGPMTILTGSFTSDGTLPNPFGTHTVDFQTPFVIDSSKNYLITIRHTGNGVSGQSMDRLASDGAYSGRSNSSYTATTATGVANWTIPQFFIEVDPPCYANCDGSTIPPILTIDDFTCFINEFAAASGPFGGCPGGNCYANCTGATTEPYLTVDDFTCFINAFAQGCP